jgi:hypothetical protein
VRIVTQASVLEQDSAWPDAPIDLGDPKAKAFGGADALGADFRLDATQDGMGPTPLGQQCRERTQCQLPRFSEAAATGTAGRHPLPSRTR